ncbi:keratin, type II cytoskeletal 80-like isoform X2 [Chiroxiphia lanceolata]|uniref:keratin, type II cytoskeletal 80-like isoform X2 n=1 Tax=Chiroxiphia lanceolata TaxID=296741 RepID=UPI0013CEF46C|nr:keratin, type II cytoskeletal 80-like isoform X2 [Chiroxiphia lanceolata]
MKGQGTGEGPGIGTGGRRDWKRIRDWNERTRGLEKDPGLEQEDTETRKGRARKGAGAAGASAFQGSCRGKEGRAGEGAGAHPGSRRCPRVTSAGPPCPAQGTSRRWNSLPARLSSHPPLRHSLPSQIHPSLGLFSPFFPPVRPVPSRPRAGAASRLMTNPSSAFAGGSLSSARGMSRARAAGPDEAATPEGPPRTPLGTAGPLRAPPAPSLAVDPELQELRRQEKDEIKALNNQFVTLIEKVQDLEQQNKVLTTRWNFLKEQDNSQSDADVRAIYEQFMGRMSQERKALSLEQENLERELEKVLGTMDAFRSKYEDEIRLCSGMEFTFMELKKDLDVSTLHRTELEVKLKGLQELMELKKSIYEQELQELLSELQDISVVLGIDPSCRVDLSRIVEDVRAQYESLARHSWHEAEALSRRKLSEGHSQAGTFGGHLLESRREIAELNIRIQKLRSGIVSQRSQCLFLEEHIREAGEQGEAALRDAKAKLVGLEEALQRNKERVAQLVKEHQELMNIKLALDVEILTYRKLMEGEESSLEQPIPAVISAVRSRPRPLSASARCHSRLFAGAGQGIPGSSPNGGGTKTLRGAQ